MKLHKKERIKNTHTNINCRHAIFGYGYPSQNFLGNLSYSTLTDVDFLLFE